MDRNLNNSRNEVLNSSFRANNLITGDVGPPNVHSVRNTHFIANNGNNDRLRSREHVGTDPAALAPQTQTGPDHADCHMATEMGLPGNGNKENRNTNTETRVPRRRIPEFLTGNTLCDTTNDVMNSTMVTQDRPNNERVSSITRLADAITSRLPAPNSSSLIKPVTTSTLTFDGKNEKFELFEDWFNTLLKMQPGITESMKINQFHAHLRKGALQTFHNISSLNKNKLEDILVVFRRKYVKPESTATAKHKWHKLIFDPNKQSLPDFLEELHQGAEKAFGENAEQMINNLLYAKLPPHLKRSVNTAYLENGTYEEIVQHLERELELNGLEGDNAPAITISTTQNAESRPPRDLSNVDCYFCKEKGHFARDCPRLKKRKERDQQEGEPKPRRTFPPCGHCGLTNHSTERCYKNPENKNRRPCQ